MKAIKNGSKMNSNNFLIGKKIKFYSQKDEEAFFEWIKRIECIERFEGAGDELYLYIASDKVHDFDLRELLALFYRYDIEMKQLQKFLIEDNKTWFCNKKGFWYRKVFRLVESKGD